MKKQETKKHIFALYLSDLQYYLEGAAAGDVITIEDEEISRRAGKILHLSRNDICIFFDQQRNIITQVVICSKTIFQVIINEINHNQTYEPYITVLLPLLKRDALETAIYNLTEIGVNKIQLVMTQKVQRKWGGQKEYARLQKICIAAAEQSKNFAFPDLCQPLMYKQALEHNPGEKIYFDTNGTSAQTMIDSFKHTPIEQSRITLTIGPEGGLLESEVLQLKKATFTTISLTPTVLRASQAITLGAGIVRSVLYNPEYK